MCAVAHVWPSPDVCISPAAKRSVPQRRYIFESLFNATRSLHFNISATPSHSGSHPLSHRANATAFDTESYLARLRGFANGSAAADVAVSGVGPGAAPHVTCLDADRASHLAHLSSRIAPLASYTRVYRWARLHEGRNCSSRSFSNGFGMLRPPPLSRPAAATGLLGGRCAPSSTLLDGVAWHGLTSARHPSAHLGSPRLTSAHLGLSHLGSPRLTSACHTSAHLGSPRLVTSRLTSAHLGSPRSPFLHVLIPGACAMALSGLRWYEPKLEHKHDQPFRCLWSGRV